MTRCYPCQSNHVSGSCPRCGRRSRRHEVAPASDEQLSRYMVGEGDQPAKPRVAAGGVYVVPVKEYEIRFGEWVSAPWPRDQPPAETRLLCPGCGTKSPDRNLHHDTDCAWKPRLLPLDGRCQSEGHELENCHPIKEHESQMRMSPELETPQWAQWASLFLRRDGLWTCDQCWES